MVITHSLVKAFKGCQNAAKYKYVDLLAPKYFRSKPLKRGTWFHEMLEARYKGESVTAVHKHNTQLFSQMFDEEKEALGAELPQEMAALYRSYAWHYRSDESWKVHEVEVKLEAELPNGMMGQGKFDMLVEDDFGLWLVDHKTHGRLPDWDYRLLDQQAPFYLWLARKTGRPVRGFIWNYVVPTAPSPLKFTKPTKNVPSRLYKVQPPVVDFPTVDAALTDEQREMPEVQEILAKLYLTRYDRDVVQTSPVFRRDLLEPEDETIERVVADITSTADRYAQFQRNIEKHELNSRRDLLVVERTADQWKCRICEFKSLCIAELTDRNADQVRRREYVPSDPFAYYGGDNEEVQRVP